MRLIDADELKSKLSDKDYITYTHEYGDAIPVEWVMSAIENAPTVFDCRGCKHNGNERECVDCHEYSNFVKYEERPQGEWIKEDEVHSKCSLCGFKYADYRILFDFCPYCGADMRGGKENE